MTQMEYLKRNLAWVCVRVIEVLIMFLIAEWNQNTDVACRPAASQHYFKDTVK